eukprot:366278-Chlamydomonas_euryale.AAC.33
MHVSAVQAAGGAGGGALVVGAALRWESAHSRHARQREHILYKVRRRGRARVHRHNGQRIRHV